MDVSVLRQTHGETGREEWGGQERGREREIGRETEREIEKFFISISTRNTLDGLGSKPVFYM